MKNTFFLKSLALEKTYFCLYICQKENQMWHKLVKATVNVTQGKKI